MPSLLTCKAYDTSVTPKKDIVFKQIVSVAPLSIAEDFDLIGEKISFGECGIFIDGCDCCFIADIKGWDSRGVDSPTQEVSLAGPQEAFAESIMTNLALVRKILKNPKLTATNIPVGKNK